MSQSFFLFRNRMQSISAIPEGMVVPTHLILITGCCSTNFFNFGKSHIKYA